MQPQILNVDILNDKEPNVFVQKYVYPDRTFLVFRKPTSPDEEFELSSGVEIDLDLYWYVTITLFETADDLDDDLLEIFAVMYLDEENAPTYDPDEHSQAQEYLNIIFDPGDQRFHCEATMLAHERLDSISAPTLDEAIALAVDEFHILLAAGGAPM